jgi:Flp pilus assembly protein CpaB
VRFVAVDLPSSVAGAAFQSPAELEGRVLVAPVGEGELLQLGALSDQVGGAPAAEVSITLARDLAVDGRLAPGDTVDVYATEDETSVAAAGVRVVAVTEAGGSFGDGSELTVTLALTRSDDGAPIVQAAREGQVTLVRTTHAAPGVASSGGPAGTTGSPPEAPGTGDAGDGATPPEGATGSDGSDVVSGVPGGGG